MRSRRGLSTVVGAIFFIIAVSSVIAYVTISMDKIDELAQAVITVESQNQEIFGEEFQVTKVRNDFNKFNLTMQNTGDIPVQIKNLWVENKSATDWVRKYSVDQNIAPGGIITNIGQNLGLTAVDTNSYAMKIATQRGNIQEVFVNSVSDQPLDIQIQASPVSLLDNFQTTVMMTVTNNMSNNNILMNIKPDIQATSGAAGVVTESSITPSSYDFLMPGDTAIFNKKFKLTGTDSQTKTIEGSLQNGYSGNISTEVVTMKAIEFSLQSATSLSSEGLAASTASDDILILHEETQDALDGRQLFSGDGENPTTLDTSTSSSYIWYTRNDTSVTPDIPAGNWNLNLRFISDEVPDGISSPDLIYHFETETSQVTPDSSGNNRDLTVSGALIGLNGQHGTQGYNFDGSNDYLFGSGISNGIDDIGTFPDSTSGWFRTGDSSSGKKTILRVGDGSGEYYEVYLQIGAPFNGELFFSYDGHTDGPEGTCFSDESGLNDDLWHHFVVVRDGNGLCKVYVDGDSAGTGDDTTSCGNCNGQRGTVAPSGDWNVGRDPSGPGDYFDGDIDQVFHWNDVALSSNDVALLYAANYGSSAHLFDFSLEKVDATGNFISTLKSDTNYPIQFWDSQGVATSWATGNLINYTAGSLSAQTFSNGDRLKLSITHVGGLNMTVRIDDPALTSPHPTYLQIPFPDTAFPSYFSYDNDDAPTLDVFNQGPNGSWVTFLTRIVFNDVSSGDAYAAHLDFACGQDLGGSGLRLDSPLIKVGDTCELIFDKPRDPPDATAGSGSGNIIPPGNYQTKVFLSGYDEVGQVFIRTVDLGTVRVVE